ncbi:hypothetical protein BpHYR1_011710 [Brachionus plicatilis]|uniref:Uncharacterized protein n=1 Tax=Brachionus plicatilis TaxID=10195 RepID=A0A3M7Q728_BRAPC|nr:hypothetical protein BpHYR1_011710 [Brachionus plicatilis]
MAVQNSGRQAERLNDRLPQIEKKSFCAERFEIVLNGYFNVLKSLNTSNEVKKVSYKNAFRPHTINRRRISIFKKFKC